MDFQLSPEQELMRDSTCQMVKRKINPLLAENAADKPLPKEAALRIFQALSQHGLTAPRIPEAAGGSGLKMLDYGIMFEQLPCAVAMAIMAHEGCITRLNAESTPKIRRHSRRLPASSMPSACPAARACASILPRIRSARSRRTTIR